jgi:hypothetical protein
VNDAIGRVWNEADMPYFKVLCWYFPKVTDKNHKKMCEVGPKRIK